MKVFIGFVILVVVGLILAFTVGGIGSFDPAADAQDFAKSVKQGMTWQQVVALRKPGRISFVSLSNDVGRTPSEKFNLERIEKKVERDNFPGMIFEYMFTAEIAYEVTFNASGNVTSIGEPASVNTLLDAAGLGQ